MFEIAADLGSDVSYFLRGGTALAEGRGERVRRLADAAPLWVVLAKPPRGLSAGEVYRTFDGLDTEGATRGSCSLEAWERVLRKSEVLPIEKMMRNDLQRAVFGLAPECEELVEVARAAGAGAMVSGSGPTVFALAEHEEKARSIRRELEACAGEVWLTRFRSGGSGLEVEKIPGDLG
jgi:4-diphosphocytidyl-2-C-methyl-D-erythritol kinase